MVRNLNAVCYGKVWCFFFMTRTRIRLRSECFCYLSYAVSSVSHLCILILFICLWCLLIQTIHIASIKSCYFLWWIQNFHEFLLCRRIILTEFFEFQGFSWKKTSKAYRILGKPDISLWFRIFNGWMFLCKMGQICFVSSDQEKNNHI